MKQLKECKYPVTVSALVGTETGIIVCDIDDTLYKADKSSIRIWKRINGNRKNEVPLSTDEYAKDPDAKIHKDWFDYREFNDPIKVSQSLIHSTPIIHNLKLIDMYINAGYEFCFLTARGCEDSVKYALKSILKVRDNNGKLRRIGNDFNLNMSSAVNDMNRGYIGRGDAEKKANILKNLCAKYNYVVFVDDDIKNVEFARNLKLSNLNIIHAK